MVDVHELKLEGPGAEADRARLQAGRLETYQTVRFILRGRIESGMTVADAVAETLPQCLLTADDIPVSLSIFYRFQVETIILAIRHESEGSPFGLEEGTYFDPDGSEWEASCARGEEEMPPPWGMPADWWKSHDARMEARNESGHE